MVLQKDFRLNAHISLLVSLILTTEVKWLIRYVLLPLYRFGIEYCDLSCRDTTIPDFPCQKGKHKAG